jgi:hypothetical protein
MKKKIQIAVAGIFVILICLGSYLLLSHRSPYNIYPKQKFESMELELGETLGTDIHDYLDGYDFILNRVILDTSTVNIDETGTYEVVCSLGKTRYIYNIIIKDTTAPVIEAVSSDKYYALGDKLPVKDFVESSFDLSGDVFLYVLEDGVKSDTLSFDETGTLEFTIYGEDASENKAECELLVNVDEAPCLIGVGDRYIKTGSEYDPGLYIFAVDNLDGLITDRIEINTGSFDSSTAGEYSILYSVEDSNGLVTSAASTVYVGDEQDIEIYLTDEDLELLCDAGYFTYEPLEEEDKDKTIEIVRKASVCLSKENGYGSGVIYKITPDYTYFISLSHVLKHKTYDITFFDDNMITYQYNYIKENKDELSLFRIPTSEIPTETLLQLKEIYYDKDIYDKVGCGTNVMCYAENWKRNQVYCKTAQIESLNYTESTLLSNSIATNNRICAGGCSGTMLVDYKGNLIGLIEGWSMNFGIQQKLDGLEDLYERRDELD